MIVADSECRAELKGYLPGAGEEQRESRARRGPRGPSAFIPVEEAAARHQCSYLVGSHMAEFLQTGGDPEWLLGLHRAPEKLRKLSEINKLLAHRPWLITKEHIQALLKTGEHSWSLAELIQALVLLTHCHSLASFVFGCGILPEGDPEGSPAPQAPSPPSEQSTPPSRDPLNHSGGFEAARDVEALMERMRQLQENLLRDEGASQEEMESRFELEKSESLLVTPSADILEPSPNPDMLCFVEDPTFGYEDFTRRGTQAPPTFRAQDYTWEDHGYSLIQRLYPEGGQLLDEKFQAAYSLTYNTIAMHSGVDTSMLRRAIWNYIHCVFGIRAAPAAYGSSQARGPIGAATAGLHHSHSNVGSKPCLQPTPQLMAMPDP